jgi:antitoxin ChpS
MHTTNLRKVGGSVMVALPPALLELVELQAGSPVGIQVENGRLVIEGRPRPRYRLADLLAETKASAPPEPVDRAWLDAPPAGREIL